METNKKKSLFGDNSVLEASKFKVNRDFAEKFQKRKERELIDKYKSKFGEGYQMEEEDSESNSAEDENGSLIDENLTDKFIETIAKIRMKHPDIYEKDNGVVFDEIAVQKVDNKKLDEKLTYEKTQIKSLLKKLDDGEEANENSSEQEQNYEELPHDEEQLRLKNEFKQAAANLVNEDGFILKKKAKTAQEIKTEQDEFNHFLKRMEKRKKPENEIDILKRFWGDKEQLDEKDRFLRKFILTKGWIDKDDLDQNGEDSEEYEQKADNFEEKYNFRYEEPGGTEIITYERNIEDTLRDQGNEKRKQKRKEKEERLQNQKKQLNEELKALKIAKSQQLAERINKIFEVGGVKQVDSRKVLNEITQDFDEKNFDKAMEKLYDDDYYENEESEEEEIEEEIEEFYNEEQLKDKNERKKVKKPVQSQLDEAIENALEIKSQVPLMLRKNLKDEQLKAIQDDGKVSIWWYCDNCTLGIQPLKPRFDCQVCEDYTLCKECYDGGFHHQEKNHKMKRTVVPKDCQPPSQEEIDLIIQKFKMCQVCQFKMTEENDYYQMKTDEGIILCEECYEQEQLENQQKFSKIIATKVDLKTLLDKNPQKIKQYVKDDEIQKLVDDYYNLDFEDVIAGGIKTKYKYIDTDPIDYGLTDDDLLYCDDVLLNQYISVKKLAPYKNDTIKMKPSKMNKMLALIAKSTKRNKKLLFKEQNKLQKLEEELEEIKKQKKNKQNSKIQQIEEKIEKIQERGNKKKKIKQNQEPVEIEQEQPVAEIELSQNRLRAYGLSKK